MILFGPYRQLLIKSCASVSILSMKRWGILISFYLPILLAVLFTLSRALWFSLGLFLLLHVLTRRRDLLFKLPKLSLFKSPRSLALLFFSIIACFFILSKYQDVQYLQGFSALIGSRGSFLLNPSQLLEGSSSGARLEALSFLTDSKIFTLFPQFPVGSATVLHNSMLQLLLEYGFPVSLLGISILAIAFFRSPNCIPAVMICLLAHQSLYNPISWLSLFYFSTCHLPAKIHTYN